MENEGIPYFLLMCQLDDKWDLIEAQYGLKGFAVVTKLYQKIYGTKGYYCEWTNEIELLFSRKTCGLPVGSNLVSDIVQAALRRNLFSQELFQEFHILTSRGIQKHYVDVVKRRLNVKMKKEYLLLEVGQIPKNVDIISINVDRTEENAYRNETSKEKESKEKGSKLKDFCSKPTAVGSKPKAEIEKPLKDQPELNTEDQIIITLPLNDKSEYPIYKSSLSEWKDLYPAVDIPQQLRNMKGWLNSNPIKRKTKTGINHFVTNWLSNEQNKGYSNKTQNVIPTVKQSRFVNFEQREWDFEDLEKKECERRRKKHENSENPTGTIKPPQ